MKYRCYVVSFGLAGHGEEYADQSNPDAVTRLSGYESPDSWVPREDVDYSNAVFLDKRKALEENYIYAYQSPLCGLKNQKMGPISEYLKPVVASFNVGCLDVVTPEQYAEWWTRRGATEGRMENGRLVWQGQDRKHGREKREDGIEY